MSVSVKDRLEELRAALRTENISYSELADLQGLADAIEPGDVELLEPAGVPEHRTEERENFLADIIICAVEGGTSHWATVHRYKHNDLPPTKVETVLGEEETLSEDLAPVREKLGRQPTVTEAIQAGVLHRVTVNTIQTGIRRIARGEVSINKGLRATISEASAENDASNIDATLSSCIVEAALFGEVRYT